MGQLLFLLGSLLAAGIGIAIYLGGMDPADWMIRGVGAFTVTLALGIADIGARRYRDILLGKFGALYALLFMVMVLYSLYLNTTA